VIGRDRADLRCALGVGPFEQSEDFGLVAPLDHEPRAIGSARQSAAQNWRKFALLEAALSFSDRDRSNVRSAFFLDVAFRRGHAFDHALVAFPGGFAPSEDAVLVEHHQLCARKLCAELDDLFREQEARHHIRHEQKPIAPNAPRVLGSIRLIDDGEHRVGVRVIDDFRR
jgi:hypothetical protein